MRIHSGQLPITELRLLDTLRATLVRKIAEHQAAEASEQTAAAAAAPRTFTPQAQPGPRGPSPVISAAEREVIRYTAEREEISAEIVQKTDEWHLAKAKDNRERVAALDGEIKRLRQRRTQAIENLTRAQAAFARETERPRK